MMALTSQLKESVINAYKQFNFASTSTYIYDFCNDHCSSFYCSIAKDVLYCDAADSDNRRQLQYSFWAILEVICRCLAPLLPHTAEEAYQALHQDKELVLILANDCHIH